MAEDSFFSKDLQEASVISRVETLKMSGDQDIFYLSLEDNFGLGVQAGSWWEEGGLEDGKMRGERTGVEKGTRVEGTGVEGWQLEDFSILQNKLIGLRNIRNMDIKNLNGYRKKCISQTEDELDRQSKTDTELRSMELTSTVEKSIALHSDTPQVCDRNLEDSPENHSHPNMLPMITLRCSQDIQLDLGDGLREVDLRRRESFSKNALVGLLARLWRRVTGGWKGKNRGTNCVS